MPLRQCSVICKREEWSKFRHDHHAAEHVVKYNEFEDMASIFQQSVQLSSSISTIHKHLLGGGINIKIGKKKPSALEEWTLFDSWKTSHFPKFLVDAHRDLFRYGICIVTQNEDGPEVVDPLTVEIKFAETLNRKRTYHIVPLTSAHIAGGGPVEHDLESTGITKRKSDKHPPKKPPASKRQKTSESGSAATATAASASASSDDSSSSSSSSDDNFEFEHLIVFEEETPALSGKLRPLMRSIKFAETGRNTLFQHTLDATARMANPTLYTVSIEATAQQRQNGMAYNVAGDNERVANEQARTAAEKARIAHDQQQDMINNQVFMEREIGLLRAKMATREYTEYGRPHAAPTIADVSATHQEPITPGRTGFLGPRAAYPAFFVEYLAYMTNESGRIAGVPSILTGDLLHASAVNQTVMFVFNATLQSVRHTLSELVECVFRKWRKDQLWTLFGRDGAPANWTPEEVVERSSRHKVSVEFLGLMDPILTNMLYEAKSIGEDVYARCMASSSGLSESDFDVKRMKQAFDRKVELEDVQIKSGNAAAKAATAAAAVSKGNDEKKKEQTTSKDLKQKEDPNMAKHGAGPAQQIGVSSSKDHHPQQAKKKKK